MKEAFEEFFELLRLDRKNSSWSGKNSISDQCEELIGEIEELKVAASKEDLKNLKEELGDCLWDLLAIFIIAEEKGIKTKEAIQDSIEKLKRRKPWIFTGEKVSVEEELKRWEEAKKIEKEQNIR